MTDAFSPRDAKDVAGLLAWAAGEQAPLDLRGRGSKRDLGRPAAPGARAVDLSALAGVDLYEPEELVLTARPGTPIAEIEALLDAQRQELAFEPPDLGPLLGAAAGRGTLGGAVACNLAGPRRIRAGAARDHFLGCKAVSGRGEAFKAGGRVVKNVTGYDVCKLLAGSFGTLAALTELTLRVAPKSEATRTVLVAGQEPARAVRTMSEAAGSPHEVSGLAFLPATVAARSRVAMVAAAGVAATVLRLEGPAASTAYRAEALRRMFAGEGAVAEIEGAESESLWREIRDVSFFVADGAPVVWRLGVAPMQGAETALAITRAVGGDYFLDWAGGQVWLALPPVEDAAHAAVRAALGAGGGHATLIRAADAVREAVSVFQPRPQALAALSRRVKQSFDPHGILNPGRMWAGV